MSNATTTTTRRAAPLAVALLIVGIDMLVARLSTIATSDADLGARVAIDIGLYAVRAVLALLVLARFLPGKRIDWSLLGSPARGWRVELRWSLAVTLAGGIGVTLLIAAAGIIALSAGVPLPAPAEQDLELLRSGAWQARLPLLIGIGVLAAIAAPVTEELIYRGVLLPPLIARFGVLPAIAIDALVFGFLHVGPYGHGGIAALEVLGGLFMSIAFAWRGSLIAPIVVHAGGNVYLAVLALVYVQAWERIPWAFA